ncbi:MAG: hypothetical protein GY953_56715, partial [bacterium]|nr:hypothetical protein [bacterium]
MKFYEHGAAVGGNSGGKTSSSRKDYASHFPISKARYIATQVVFENLRRGENEFEYDVTMGLYTFDNQLISAHKKKMLVAADWSFAWATQSYGWKEAGRWSVGTYRVKVWLGEEKVGEAAIYLHDDSKELPPSVAEIGVKSLEFYEGGGFFRPGPAEQAGTKFARSKTRRIYWVLGGENKLHQVRAQRPNIVGYFYRPDGTLLGEAANRFLIAPEVKDVVLVEGIGWATPGSWEPGRYRFELEQDHRVVAEKFFEITDPFVKPRERPRVIHYGIIDAGVFAGTAAEPADEIGRKYQSEFARRDTRHVWSELVVVNNPNHTKPHAHKISWQYYGPDGALLGKTETDFMIQPEWKTARQKASFGWADPGKWKAGAYKVRIVVDGELARVVRFE